MSNDTSNENPDVEIPESESSKPLEPLERKPNAPRTYPNGSKVRGFDVLAGLFEDERVVPIKGAPLKVRIRCLSSAQMTRLGNRFIVMPPEDDAGNMMLDDEVYMEKSADAQMQRQVYLIEEGLVAVIAADGTEYPFEIAGNSLAEKADVLHNNLASFIVDGIANAIENLATKGEAELAAFY